MRGEGKEERHSGAKKERKPKVVVNQSFSNFRFSRNVIMFEDTTYGFWYFEDGEEPLNSGEKMPQ